MYSTAQKRALATSRSVWLTANAGTGKTEVLTGRVLRLLLEGVAPQNILCMTYTKAAASEMAARIREKIVHWVCLPDAALCTVLSGLLEQETVPAALCERARALFGLVVDRPDALHVTTLHGFCQQLLMQFPLEAGISPGFTALEEAEAARLHAEVLEQVLVLPELAEPVRFLARELRDDAWHPLLKEALALRTKIDWHKEEVALPQDRRAEPSPHQGALLQLAELWVEAGHKTEPQDAHTLRGWLLAGEEAEKHRLWPSYAALFLSQKQEKLARIVRKPLQEKKPELEPLLRQEQERVFAVQQEFIVAQTRTRTRHLQRLLQCYFSRLDEVKKHRGVLEYGDLIALCAALLNRAEAKDWVRFKLEGGITHLLLDEAQDTGPEQWAIVAALCEEFFVGAGSAAASVRSLFVVGDPKQSIYRFQGAEAVLFSRQQRQFQQVALAAAKPFSEESLSLSYRSGEAVLRLVDGVLQHGYMQQRLGLKITPPHDLHRKDAASTVVLWPMMEAPEPFKTQGWEMPDGRVEQPDAGFQLVQAIMDCVEGWLQEQHVLEAKGRPIEPGDILILLRQRGSMMERLVRAAKQRGIPVAGVDQLRVSRHLWVQDLLALARFLLLPQDDFSLAAVLVSPLFGLEDAALRTLCANRGEQTLWHVVQAQEEAIAATLNTYLNLADFGTPYALFLHVLESDGAKQRALARMGPDVLEITHAFQEHLQQYEASETPSLQGFVDWFEGRDIVVKRSPEGAGNKLRIMTIHGAKGLQAPIVILADACRGRNTKAQQAMLYADEAGGMWWLKDEIPAEGRLLKEAEKQAEEAESARLFYVALTRAEDVLYICGWHTVGHKNEDALWAKTVQEVMEQEGAESVPAPAAFGNRMALRLYSPQREKITAKVKHSPSVGSGPLPGFITRPAPQEKISARQKATSTTTVFSPEAVAKGIALHKALEQQSMLHPEVRAIMEHPEFQAYFDPACSLAEVTVKAEGFTGRMDRLIVLPQEVIILDFKTSETAPETMPKAYQQQLMAYSAALSPLYPHKTIRAGLLYTATKRILWV